MSEGTKNKKSASRCSNFGPTAHKTVVLAIDLVGWSAANSHRLVERVLEDKKVQGKLAAELKKVGEELMKEQTAGKPLSVGSTIVKIGATAGGALKKPMTDQVKQSIEYKKLDSSLTRMKCAFDNTPVGAFVNENKTLLIVIGSVAAIGGGVAMYYSKAGDTPAKGLKILPMLLPTFSIGAIDLSVKNLEFKPSERKIATDVTAKGKWNGVQADFQLGATFANDAIVRAAGKGNLVLTLNPGWQAMASGAFNWSRENAEMRTVIQGSAAVGVRRKLSNRANLNLQFFGSYADTVKGITGQGGIKSDLSINNAMGKNTRLTVSPSYSTKVTQARDSRGLGAARTDHRVFINLKLEFDLGMVHK